jgi:two-component system chemotaxis response regulator CheB
MIALNKRCLKFGDRIKVLVVDDSVVIRRLVTNALEADPLLEVVGTAANGVIALQRIAQHVPDVITLDIEMPEMDGLETLRHIRRDFPYARTIMFSTMTERGAAITLEALGAGADDYVTKASNEGSLDRSLVKLRTELIPKIKQFFAYPAAPGPRPVDVAPIPPVPIQPAVRPRAIAIGVSTGGPTALAQILPLFPAGFRMPVLVVQHMPPLFTRFLADRLRGACALPVEEASHGVAVEPGKILIAPGDFHLRVACQGDGIYAMLDTAPPLNSCRPSVDFLFMSVAEVYGSSAIGIILTGMGQDGLLGAGMIKSRGGRILAQDEASSVVWGMPGAVVRAGLAERVLPLDHLMPALLRMTGGPV